MSTSSLNVCLAMCLVRGERNLIQTPTVALSNIMSEIETVTKDNYIIRTKLPHSG